MRFIIFVILCLTSQLIFAADPTPDISIVNTVQEAIKLASTSIMPQALMWLGSLMGLQFVITNYSVIKADGDLATLFAKLLGTLLWFMFCFYVIQNGPDFIDSVGNGVLSKFAPNLPSPGSIITATLSICSSILIGIVATGTSIAGIGNSSIAMTLVYICFFIFAIGSFMAIKLIMLQLELGLIVMMSPLSFAFLGLNALKDQGVAPFKSLISLIYRIILLGVVFTAFSKVIDVTGAQLDQYNWANPFDWPSKIQLIFSMLFAFPVCAFLVWKSDAIAASLSSGSTNMGTGDVASAAAAGAALGAAAGAGGASVGDVAAKSGQSMSEVMKKLNAGSVSNDSPTGAGGFDQKIVGTAPTPPPKVPEMSMAQMNADRARMRPGNGSASSGNVNTPTVSTSSGPGGGSSSGTSGNGNTTPASSSSGSAATKAANTIDNMEASGQIQNTDTAKHVSDHLKSMGSDPGDAKAVGEAPSKAATSGSGESASIGGASSATDQKLDKLMESMAQPNKPGFKDRLANANDHVAKEQAATVVSINTHHTD
jgi:type IV secretion system protein TrbL